MKINLYKKSLPVHKGKRRDSGMSIMGFLFNFAPGLISKVCQSTNMPLNEIV